MLDTDYRNNVSDVLSWFMQGGMLRKHSVWLRTIRLARPTNKLTLKQLVEIAHDITTQRTVISEASNVIQFFKLSYKNIHVLHETIQIRIYGNFYELHDTQDDSIFTCIYTRLNISKVLIFPRYLLRIFVNYAK